MLGLGSRGWIVLALAALLVFGCASGDAGPGPGTDGGRTDGSPMDARVGDAGPDGGPRDAGTDGGPPAFGGTCEACETHTDCRTGSYCVSLSVGGKACVEGCVADVPSCPRAFSCVLDVTSGVDTTVCLPVGGTCCVDQDADGYGQGVGCMGPDCNDDDENVNPGADEICDGLDQNCDGVADDPPTDCASGRCTDDGDGTYTAIESGTCVDAACTEGTVTDCGLFTCEDGGEAGIRCATSCAPGGTDDDAYCVASAHCDDGACVPDLPNGEACDEDSDCVVGRCDNGFCCDSGTCCRVTADCPGGGAVTTICENNATCQGSRGETECTTAFRCMTTSGIPDDSACGPTTRALDCGLYDPVFCTGASDQPAPSCPTSCLVDADCIDAAHCEVGFCVPDRPAGLSCTRNPDCQDGLYCVDGVCCTSSCTGTCEACNLAGSAGTCTAVPSGADPAGECPGFSCLSYFSGFGAGEDVCYYRQDVGDAAASCNGARACTSPSTLCPTQPRGAVQIDCDNTCQAPVAGTCTGTTAGSCTNLDSPAITTTCGTGACARTVQRCTGGRPTTCTPGTPTAEICNGIDDDCDGSIDEGTAASLCPSAPNVASYMCNAGGTCAIGTCNANYYDINGTYGDGCECADDPSGNSCGSAYNVGSIAWSGTTGGSASVSGVLAPSGAGAEDWYRVDFPATPPPGDADGRPGGGTPRIRVTAGTGIRLDVRYTCTEASRIACGTEGGTAASVTDWSFTDNASTAGPNQFTGLHSRPWPATVYFRVTRTSPPTTCAQASYSISVTR